jgi:hypothetical protein
MSSDERPRRTRQVLSEPGNRFARLCFGDRPGLILFLGALLFFTLTLRIEPIINDTNTPLNALIAVADGHLYLDNLAWGPPTGSPGMHVVDDRLYGRNYGQVLLALPFYWLVKAATVVADLRIVLVAGWCLLLVAFADQLGVAIGRRAIFDKLGSALALGVFGLNVWFASPLDHSTIPLLALQASTMVAAALVGVVTYRLVGDIYDRRVGFTAGFAVVLASPVGFWAIFPKRHTLTALATVLVVASLYWSRASDRADDALRHRALAYVWVAVLTWVHAPEGFILFVGLGVVDVMTVRTNHPRHLLLVGFAFLAALLPFFLTNYLISGNPMTPPRTLPQTPDVTWTLLDNGVVETASGSTGSEGGASVGGEWESGPPSFLAAVLFVFVEHVMDSLGKMMDVDRLYHVFIRGGYQEPLTLMDRNIAIRLSVLESMPMFGALVAVPVLLYRRIGTNKSFRSLRREPLLATDLLVLVIASLFILTYWPRLPIHASFTVRYLHPLYPLGIYGLLRLSAIRAVISGQHRLLGWSYASFVLVGGQLLVIAVATVPRTIGEAVQFHALLSLFGAALVAAWALAPTRRDVHERVGAVLLAFAAATTTLFLLVSGIVYFSYTTNYGLPMSRVAADLLSVLDGASSIAKDFS